MHCRRFECHRSSKRGPITRNSAAKFIRRPYGHVRFIEKLRDRHRRRWNHGKLCIGHFQFAAKSILLQFKIPRSLDCPDANRIDDLQWWILMRISSLESSLRQPLARKAKPSAFARRQKLPALSDIPTYASGKARRGNP